MRRRFIALIVLDGWGYSPQREGNAIVLARTPNYDKLLKQFPNTLVHTSGPFVGLPQRAQHECAPRTHRRLLDPCDASLEADIAPHLSARAPRGRERQDAHDGGGDLRDDPGVRGVAQRERKPGAEAATSRRGCAGPR